MSYEFSQRFDAFLAEVAALATRVQQCWLLAESDGQSPGGTGAVLRIIAEHGTISVPQIARRRGTSRQNTQVIVNRLKARGSISFEPNPAHMRSPLLSVTPSGRRLLEQTRQAEAAIKKRLTAEVPDEELASATDFLRRIRILLRPEVASKRRRRSSEIQPVALETPKPPLEPQLPDELFPVSLL